MPQHVLRFWETRFGQIRPVKRAGGRRYYRPQDVELVAGIRHLLHVQRYTIAGAQRVLKENGIRFVQAVGRGEAVAAEPRIQEVEDARRRPPCRSSPTPPTGRPWRDVLDELRPAARCSTPCAVPDDRERVAFPR